MNPNLGLGAARWMMLAGPLAAAVQPIDAGVIGSKHDFSAQGWGSNRICIFCHTPHNAMTGGANGPLWNHRLTTATYAPYSSPTLQQAPLQPRAPSKLCLSCHDGTVAIDSFGGGNGGQIVSGKPSIGTGLSDDHPVSILWNHQTLVTSSTFCLNCHSIEGNPRGWLPFYDRYVECPTCQEPHDKGLGRKMLRRALGRSETCRYCHEK